MPATGSTCKDCVVRLSLCPELQAIRTHSEIAVLQAGYDQYRCNVCLGFASEIKPKYSNTPRPVHIWTLVMLQKLDEEKKFKNPAGRGSDPAAIDEFKNWRLEDEMCWAKHKTWEDIDLKKSRHYCSQWASIKAATILLHVMIHWTLSCASLRYWSIQDLKNSGCFERDVRELVQMPQWHVTWP